MTPSSQIYNLCSHGVWRWLSPSLFDLELGVGGAVVCHQNLPNSISIKQQTKISQIRCYLTPICVIYLLCKL